MHLSPAAIARGMHKLLVTTYSLGPSSGNIQHTITQPDIDFACSPQKGVITNDPSPAV